jgi:signal transduction histidine kinase/DNA-binding response OmpR family regulator
MEPIPSADRAKPQFEPAARRIARRTLLEAMALTGLAALAGALCGWLAAGTAGLPPLPGTFALGLACGTLAALLVARRQARILAAAVARPIEMIVEHLQTSGEDIIPQLKSPQQKRLNTAHLAADEALLRERFTAVEERAREALAQLEAARVQASLQNAAKSQFLANMGHELRTPLNAVLGYAMLLQEDAKAAGNTAAVADLERIALAGRQLVTLINDILDLSRLEAGKTGVERAVIDIRSLTEGAIAELKAEHGGEEREFRLDVHADAGIIIGDMTKVRQCLVNLLTSACKYSEAGPISLDVEIVERGAAAALFTIGDIPIDPDRLDRLFNPEVEANEQGTQPLDGSELRLAVTRRLARMMDGDVAIRANADSTSAFLLTLPLNRGAKPSRELDPPNQDTPGGGLSPKFGRTALVIDDNSAAVDLMQRWLSKLDYEVVSTSAGAKGLAIAKTRRFDLIVLDVFLPDLSGYDILKELRADSATADTPIILVTVDDDRIKGLVAGATEHLRKPVSEQQLRSMLEIYREPVAGDILVIEDDDDAAELVIRCAEQVGFATRRASDGLEGVAMAMARRPSAIVLDLAMPRCDGFGVMEALLAHKTLATVPVIVLSAGEISLDDHKLIVDAGYRFLTKGLHSPREIAAQLRELTA